MAPPPEETGPATGCPTLARVTDEPRPRVAVVIATKDRADFLRDALAALAPVLRGDDELIVVDNGSRDDRTQRVAEDAGVPWVLCDRPGAAAARNVGAAATTAPIIAVTDDDCRPRPGWTAAIEAAFADPQTGFVTGRVVADRPGADSPVVLDEPDPRTYAWPQDPMHFGHGANSAFRRTAFTQVGGYDELLGPGARFRNAEDHDLFWRINRAGWQGRYEPSAVVEHPAWRSRRELFTLQWIYGLGTGAFAAKALRLEPAVGRSLLRARLLDQGLLLAGRLLRKGWEGPAMEQVVKVAGVLVGVASTWRYTTVAGHYQRRATRRGSGSARAAQ